MSGCNCIEQHGGVPQRPALQTLRGRSEVQSPDVLTPEVLNCTPDHEFRTFKQSVRHRATELCGSSSVAQVSSSTGACLDAIVLEQKHGGAPQSRPCRRAQSGSEVQSPDVLHASPQLHARSRVQNSASRVSCAEERLTSHMRIIQCSFSDRRRYKCLDAPAEAGGVPQRSALQTLRSGPKCSHQMCARQGSSTARQITSSELSSRVSCHRATDELRDHPV
jgi:hypothetical protein